MRGGWYLVALESELTGELTPVDIGPVPLVLVAGEDDRVRAFDAICPHQGAHLGYGGRLDARSIVCPFHGNKVTLGAPVGSEYCVDEYPTLGYGGMIFVRLSAEYDHGLAALLDTLIDDHLFVPFNCTPVAVAGEFVIENAFDSGHFRPVHGVRNSPRFTVRRDAAGAFVAEGTLYVPTSPWHRGAEDSTLAIPFRACAVSPQLVFSQIGGANPYWVITGTCPTDDGCVVRQALAVPQSGDAAPDAERITYLARASKAGLEQDRVIWEHLRIPAEPSYGPDENAVAAFREYCRDTEHAR